MNFSQKIKKVPLSRRSVSFLLLGFLVFFLFSLPLPASAGVWDVVVGGLTAIPTLVILVGLAFTLLFSQTFAFISGALLNWVLSPNFVAISYTSPVDRGDLPGNPIIKIGLDITKSGVNLFLVLFLVYIAVAIALRMGGEGNAKKMLVRLILVALLVNFAPVLVGLIVDASNIVMNSTLAGVGTGFSDVLTQFSVWGNGLVSKLLRIPTFAGQMGLLAQVMVMVALNFAIGLALLLYAALFIFRYVVIWILVIFSPLAFVCWIVPPFKKYWDMWWSNLLEWSFIGAFLAYFLYLGAQAIRLLPTVYQQPITMPGFSSDVAGAFSQSLPYAVVLVFLYLGFTLGLQTSAMGAGAVIGLTKRSGKWVGGKAGDYLKRRVEESARVREAATKAVQWVEKSPWHGRLFLPDAARKYAQFRPAVDEAQKKASFQSSKELGYRMATNADSGINAVGNMMELIDRGDSQDLFDAYKTKYSKSKFDGRENKDIADSELYDVEEFRSKMGRYLQIALRSGKHNAVLRADPRLAKYAFNVLPGYSAEDLKDPVSGKLGTAKSAVEKATIEARRAHIGKWEREVVEDNDVVSAGLSKGTEFWSAIDTQVKKGQETSLKTIDRLFTNFINSRPGMAHATENDIDTAWEAFEKTYKDKYGPGMKGYFEAVRKEGGDGRFMARGWRRGDYTEPGGPTPAGGGGTGGGGTGGGGTGGGGSTPDRGGQGTAGQRPIGGPGVRARAGRRKTSTRPTAGGATGMTP